MCVIGRLHKSLYIVYSFLSEESQPDKTLLNWKCKLTKWLEIKPSSRPDISSLGLSLTPGQGWERVVQTQLDLCLPLFYENYILLIALLNYNTCTFVDPLQGLISRTISAKSIRENKGQVIITYN